jgi:hypothetical protein
VILKFLKWLTFVFRSPKAPIPRPFRTHGCSTFWRNHGSPIVIGSQIDVKMESGKIATFRLCSEELAWNSDWSWYDFEFVRYKG